MSALLTIIRREFASFFYAPIAYVVAVFFLALNGFSFWVLMKALSDPNQPAQAGAVLRHFFGGTLLHWLLVFVVVAALSMRTVAEERRLGLWEAQLTTRVGAGALLLGKWLALLGFYLLLWLPTLVLLVIFAFYAPEGNSADLGPIAASYLGVAIIGGALCAIGIAVSTSTQSQVVAAIVSVALFFGWLMVGELNDLSSSYSATSPWLELVDLRAGMAQLARGEIQPAFLAALLSIAIVFLALATTLAVRGKVQRLRWAIATILLAVLGSSVSTLTARHMQSSDWSASQVNSLEPATSALLATIDTPIEVVIVMPSEAVFDGVHKEVERLIARMQSRQELLEVRHLDPLSDPSAVAQWAYELAIRPEDLSSGGAVVFRRGGRSQVVDLLSMASFAADDLGVGAMSAFHAESSFRHAIAAVIDLRREVLCTSLRHGELAPEIQPGSSSPHWAASADRLSASGVDIKIVGVITTEALKPCDGIALIGPVLPLSAVELLALNAYLEAGGDLLLALADRPDVGQSGYPITGLELLLSGRGVEALNAAAVDPEHAFDGPTSWMTFAGYGSHAIVADFSQKRATLWSAPRVLRAARDDVKPLVFTSPKGWAETELQSVFDGRSSTRSEQEERAPSVAVAQQDSVGSRLVVIGSARASSSEWTDRGLGGNERLLSSSGLWLLERQLQFAAHDKRPEQIRLIMTESQLRGAFIWCVLIAPLVFAVIGALLWWWRRRED